MLISHQHRNHAQLPLRGHIHPQYYLEECLLQLAQGSAPLTEMKAQNHPNQGNRQPVREGGRPCLNQSRAHLQVSEAIQAHSALQSGSLTGPGVCASFLFPEDVAY